MVSAPALAKQRGIQISETKQDAAGAYDSYIRLVVKTERQERSVAGTVFSDGKPRIIQVKGINMEAELSPRVLYITNTDQPGFIGSLGMILGANDINIASFNLGRDKPSGAAISLISVDEEVSADVLNELEALPHVVQVKKLYF